MVKAVTTILHVEHSDASKLTSELLKKIDVINKPLMITNTVLRIIIIAFIMITIHPYSNPFACYDSLSFYFMFVFFQVCRTKSLCR